MKYQSEIINSILDGRGHELSTLHYESECINQWIEEEKGAYPKLIDYQGEWLNYIYHNIETGGEGGGTSPDEPDEPIVGEFPYETFNGTSGKIENVVPLAYKRAILYGKSEIVNDTLQSVKMPVLKTTGKNLWDSKWYEGYSDAGGGGVLANTTLKNAFRTNYIPCSFNDKITVEIFDNTVPLNGSVIYYNLFDNNYNKISTSAIRLSSTNRTLIINNNQAKYIVFHVWNSEPFAITTEKLMVVRDDVITAYEPYKSNILTVNEDVTLRSNGNICDELNLLTGQLTQRIDEDGGVLSQEVVKSINLTVVNENNQATKLKPIEGTMHIQTTSNTIKPIAELEIPVEAITQNLASFIE